MKSENELRNDFWNELKENDPKLYAKRVDGSQNDQTTDIRVNWCDFLDRARQNGDATNDTLQNATL